MPQTAGYPIEKAVTLRSKKWEESVNIARRRLKIGQDHRMAEREELWMRNEDQYRGNHWDVGPDDPDSDLMVVNMSFSTIHVIMPYMTGSQPRFLVVPYSGNATKRNAAIQQALLNRQWRSRKMAGNRHAKAAVWDYLVLGDGFMKAGYTYEDKRTSEGEYNEVARVWVNRVSPWDMWIDPTSTGIHDARWVAQRLWVTKDEVEADDMYMNKGTTNLSYAEPSMEGIKTSKQRVQLIEEEFDGQEYAVLYEYYDLVKMQMITFSDGAFPLRVVEDIGECPIVQMGNYRIPDSPWHMGELEQIYTLQQELNRTRSHLITHRRRNVAKLLAKEGALEQSALDALRSPIVNEVAFVKGDQPLDSLVRPVDLAPLQGDVYNVSELMQNDIYEITGVNEYLRGASPDIRRTATEASIIEGASNIKSQYKLAQIEEMLTDIGALILGFSRDIFPTTDYDELQLFLTGRDAEMVQRADMESQMMAAEEGGALPEELAMMQMQGMKPAEVVVSPSPDVFEGEYEVEVESHSTELRNPMAKEQRARELAMSVLEMAPVLMQLGVTINYKRLVEDWFTKAGVEDVDGLLQDQSMMMPPPMGAPGGEGAGLANAPGQPPTNPMDVLQMGMLGEGNTGALPPTA